MAAYRSQYIQMELLGLLIFTSFLVILIHGFRNRPRTLRKLPPGPRGLPLIGNLFQIGNRPHEYFASLAKSYGPIIFVRLGFVPTVVVSSVDMAKEILQKHDDVCAGRTIPDAATAEPNYEISVSWLPPGPLWRNLRKLMNTQIFTVQRLDVLQELRNNKILDLVRFLREVSTSGQAVNIGKLAYGTVFNMLSSTIYSIDLLDLRSEAAQEFKDLTTNITEMGGRSNLSDVFPLLRVLDVQRIRRSTKVSFDRLHRLINDIVDQRLRSRALGSARQNDFLDVILDHSEEHGAEFDRRQVNSLLSVLFLAGTDTTTTAVEWIMAEMLHNPDILAQAQQEVLDKIVPGKPVQESDIPQLPYVQAVVKEALRLHQVGPLLLPHKAINDVEVGGYIIPKNTQVLVNAWAISQDSSLWEDPKSFKPQRFLRSDIDFRGLDVGFFPFGCGRRMCPGMPLAIRMLILIVATLIHSFNWKLPGEMMPHEMDMSDKFGFTVQKATPLLAIPICR